jgi:dTDP-4-dehydrorhamnose reductase
MARRALDPHRRVVAVSRFADPAVRTSLEASGVETLAADLQDPAAVAALPDIPDIVYMAGQKFGTSAAPHSTWLLNAGVAALVSTRFPGHRLVVFSTGNVYPLVPATSRGARESDPVGPVGEYAQSCLARERLFEAAAAAGSRVTIVRLNYAIDLRYGVLVDIARRVWSGGAVALGMGYVNVIWQGDANARALQCLGLAQRPAVVLNLTGSETLGVRSIAEQFGARLGRTPRFEGTEADDALLSNASRSLELFGPATVPLATMLDWVAAWLVRGGRLLGKPTHFEERTGRF